MQFQNKCKICGKSFLDTTEKYHHMKSFHDMTTEQQIKQKNSGEVKEITNFKVNLNRHMFISGQTQSGKSVAAKFIFTILPKKTKAIFYDYKNDPNHFKFIQHFPIFTNLNDIKQHFIDSDKSFWSGKQKDMRVIYRPPRAESKSVKTHSLENPNWQRINDLCDYVFKHGNIVLFIDEIAPFTTSQTIPPALYDLYIMGASRGVAVVSITQRPNVVHNTMISESYTRLLFRHELESDRVKLKGIVGAEVSDTLHRLPNQVFQLSYVNGQHQKAHLNIPKKYSWIF